MKSSLANFKIHRENEWVKKIDNEIIDHLEFIKRLNEKTFVNNARAKYYIAALSIKGVPCKVINLGAGVKKVIISGNVCSMCKGKGMVE